MLKHTLIALALTTTAASAAPVDWTPYLKGMQHDCDTEELKNFILDDEIPKSLKPSVIKKTDKIGDVGGGTVSLHLKNATAFGQPLTKVSVGGENDGDGYSLKLHFPNTNFMKLLPKFTVGDGRYQAKAGTQVSKTITHTDINGATYTYTYITHKTGYEIHHAGYTGLDFNKKQKTISCSHAYGF